MGGVIVDDCGDSLSLGYLRVDVVEKRLNS